ncbi:MAG TPA: dihydrodipicolinate reductase [Anaeromyxobacter sp.]|nr:dihydrodipicolinate reductase [Anaeromyxobacter sp.]
MGSSGIPVVVMGLGEIGRAIARVACARPDFRVVGAVDPHPSKAGRRLEEVLGRPAPDVPVSAGAAASLAAAKGGVVLHATASRIEAVLPEIEAAVRAGLHVVSTCEELAWPWLEHAEVAQRLDALCHERNVAVVGTGVNPGFVLDRLPVFLSQVTGPVRHVHGLRVVDASRRRPALQRKIGAGLGEDAFHQASERGEVGHVGLAESAALVAEGCLGLEDYEVDVEVAPLLALEDAGGSLPVRKGQVAGLQETARVFAEGREVVRLELEIAIGAEDPRDELVLDADPPLRLVVPGGIPGDEATAHAVVNAVHALTELRGLVSVLDLPAGR